MSALAFQLQGLVSGCFCVSWCFTCDQNWITLTGLWPLCTCVALGPFLCIEHSKQLLKSTISYNSHKRTALSVQKKKKRLQSLPGLVAHPWSLMRSTVHFSAQFIPNPIPPLAAGTVPLPEHPQPCTGATQPFTRYFYVSTFVSLEWSWANLDLFISSIKFHCAGISTAVSYST